MFLRPGAGLLAGLVASSELWIELERSFPRSPVITIDPGIGVAVEYLLSLGLGILLGYFALYPGKTSLVWPILACLAFLIFLDQNRIQPWVYFYSVILVAVAADRDNALRNARIVLSGLYFWSGIHKLNLGFSEEVLPSLVAQPSISWACKSLRLEKVPSESLGFRETRLFTSASTAAFSASSAASCCGILFFRATRRFWRSNAAADGGSVFLCL